MEETDSGYDHWSPSPGPKLLSPFGHQVAGQSSMLWYDSSTVCKPLIARENFFYQTLPAELAEFTPKYRGEIEVYTKENSRGFIELYGVPVDSQPVQGYQTCFYCSDESSDSCHEHSPSPGFSDCPTTLGPIKAKMTKSLTEKPKEKQCVVRVLRGSNYDNTGFDLVDSQPNCPETLNPWSKKNHQRLLEKMRKSEHNQSHFRFILLQNMVASVPCPSILDLKIGSRLHGDDASSKKVASQSQKCQETTSALLGVRLCGMQVYQINSGKYKHYDKFHGRTLTPDSFKTMLHEFLHDGSIFRVHLLQPIIERLSRLIAQLQGLSSYRFYASSLLIIYNGDIGDTNIHAGKVRMNSLNETPCQSSNLLKDRCESNDIIAITSEDTILTCNVRKKDDNDVLKRTQCLNNKTESNNDLCGGVDQDSSNHCDSKIVSPTSNFVIGHKESKWNNTPLDCYEINYNIPYTCFSSSPYLSQNKDVNITSDEDRLENRLSEKQSFCSTRPKEKKSISEASKHYSVNQISESDHFNTNVSYPSKSHNSLKKSFDSGDSSCLIIDKTSADHSSGKNETDISDNKTILDIKMIDFAHTTHQGYQDRIKHQGPDLDYINGLANLVQLFKELELDYLKQMQ